MLADAAIPSGFEVATVDHRLRPESAAEAALVAAACAERGIAHATLAVEVKDSGNLEANARDARYRALDAWASERGLGAIVTAHHLDDQAETLLMRLSRGAGVRGLAAMRPRASVPGSTRMLLRPLLGWRRVELAQLVASAGIVPVRDPSNADPRFERAVLRRRLTELAWLDPRRIAASASHLADADAALAWAAARELSERVERDGGGWTYRPQAPRAIRLRVLEHLVGGAPRGAELARLLVTLEAGGTATLGQMRVSVKDGVWRFAPAPPRRG